MERNKKNTSTTPAEAKAKKERPRGADAGLGVEASVTDSSEQKVPAEINGPKGPEPTRYGDWEQKGRCTDF